MDKTRLIEDAERREIIVMHEAGHTLTEIVERTGRHHSAISKVLRSAKHLVRPFKSRQRVLFTAHEIRLMRDLAAKGLSAAEMAEHLPGRGTASINSKLQAMGMGRSREIPRETRETILRMKAEGLTVREIAKLTGVSKSSVAGTHSAERLARWDDPEDRRVIDGDICRITTGNRKYEIICDAADIDLLPKSSIYRGANGYPICRIDGNHVYLHHVIMGKPPVGKVVDHVNGDRMDCRRSNLRFATHSQNTQNARRRGVGKCGYLGVQPMQGGKFSASVVLKIGTFDTAEEAARAYDAKAIELFGEFAMTNAKRGLFEEEEAE